MCVCVCPVDLPKLMKWMNENLCCVHDHTYAYMSPLGTVRCWVSILLRSTRKAAVAQQTDNVIQPRQSFRGDNRIIIYNRMWSTCKVRYLLVVLHPTGSEACAQSLAFRENLLRKFKRMPDPFFLVWQKMLVVLQLWGSHHMHSNQQYCCCSLYVVGILYL